MNFRVCSGQHGVLRNLSWAICNNKEKNCVDKFPAKAGPETFPPVPFVFVNYHDGEGTNHWRDTRESSLRKSLCTLLFLHQEWTQALIPSFLGNVWSHDTNKF